MRGSGGNGMAPRQLFGPERPCDASPPSTTRTHPFDAGSRQQHQGGIVWHRYGGRRPADCTTTPTGGYGAQSVGVGAYDSSGYAYSSGQQALERTPWPTQQHQQQWSDSSQDGRYRAQGPQQQHYHAQDHLYQGQGYVYIGQWPQGAYYGYSGPQEASSLQQGDYQQGYLNQQQQVASGSLYRQGGSWQGAPSCPSAAWRMGSVHSTETPPAEAQRRRRTWHGDGDYSAPPRSGSTTPRSRWDVPPATYKQVTCVAKPSLSPAWTEASLPATASPPRLCTTPLPRIAEWTRAEEQTVEKNCQPPSTPGIPTTPNRYISSRTPSADLTSMKNLSNLAIQRFHQASDEPVLKKTRWDMKSKPAKSTSRNSSEPKTTVSSKVLVINQASRGLKNSHILPEKSGGSSGIKTALNRDEHTKERRSNAVEGGERKAPEQLSHSQGSVGRTASKLSRHEKSNKHTENTSASRKSSSREENAVFQENNFTAQKDIQHETCLPIEDSCSKSKSQRPEETISPVLVEDSCPTSKSKRPEETNLPVLIEDSCPTSKSKRPEETNLLVENGRAERKSDRHQEINSSSENSNLARKQRRLEETSLHASNGNAERKSFSQEESSVALEDTQTVKKSSKREETSVSTDCGSTGRKSSRRGEGTFPSESCSLRRKSRRRAEGTLPSERSSLSRDRSRRLETNESAERRTSRHDNSSVDLDSNNATKRSRLLAEDDGTAKKSGRQESTHVATENINVSRKTSRPKVIVESSDSKSGNKPSSSSISREAKSVVSNISAEKKSSKSLKEANVQQEKNESKSSSSLAPTVISKPLQEVTLSQKTPHEDKLKLSSSKKLFSSKIQSEVDGQRMISKSPGTLSPPKFNTSFKIPKKALPNPLLESEPEKNLKKVSAPPSWLQKSQTSNPIPLRSALNTSVKPPGIEKLKLSRTSSVWSIIGASNTLQHPANAPTGSKNLPASASKSSDIEDILGILEGRTEVNLDEACREAQAQNLQHEIRAAQLGLRSRSRISTSEINSNSVKPKTANPHCKDPVVAKSPKPKSASKDHTSKDHSSKDLRKKKAETPKRKRKGSSDEEWTPRARSRSKSRAKSRTKSRAKSRASRSQLSPEPCGVASRTRSRTRSPSTKAGNGFSRRLSSDSESDEGDEPCSSWSNRNIQHWIDQSTEEDRPTRRVLSTVPDKDVLENTLRDNQRKKAIFTARKDTYVSLETIVSQRDAPVLTISPSMPRLVAYGDISPHNQQAEMPNLLASSPSGALPQSSSEQPDLPVDAPNHSLESIDVEAAVPVTPSSPVCSEEVSVEASPAMCDDLIIEEHQNGAENPKPTEFEIIALDDSSSGGKLDCNLPYKDLWAKISATLRYRFEAAEDYIALSNSHILTFISRFTQAEKMKTKALQQEQFRKLKEDFISDFTKSWAKVQEFLLELHEDFSDKEIFTILRKKLEVCPREDMSDIQSLVEDMKHLNQFLINPKVDKLTKNCGTNVTMVGKLFVMHELKKNYVMALVRGREQVGPALLQRQRSASMDEEEIPRTPSRDSGILGDTSPRPEEKIERPRQEEFKCSRCSTTAALQCSACPLVYYCTEECQMSHWSEGHSSKCGSTKQQK